MKTDFAAYSALTSATNQASQEIKSVRASLAAISAKRKTEAEIERELFSFRLRHALESNGYDGHSPTKLHREVTARSNRSLTAHAVRKWLMGESIPTQASIQVLADWLRVSPSWLRFGTGDDAIVTVRSEKLAPENVRLLADLAQLSARDAHMIRTLASLMVKERAAA